MSRFFSLVSRRERPIKPYEARTVEWMLGRVVTDPDWDRLPEWPPDVFACTAVILHVTGAFRFAVSPPSGQRWPPTPDWSADVEKAARQWVDELRAGGTELPDLVAEHWETLGRARTMRLEDVANGTHWPTCVAILTLHAVVDETLAGLDDYQGGEPGSFEGRAWQLVAQTGSLSRLPPSGIRILPKSHLSQGGINLRSLSRHLSSHVSPVDVSWTRVVLGDVAERREVGTTWNVLLLPWPLEIDEADFGPSARPVLGMDPKAFGFFAFDPQRRLDLSYVRASLASALERGIEVHAVVLPEAALLPEEIGPLEDVLVEHGAIFLAAGVREPPDAESHLGRNYAHIGLWSGAAWTRLEADKHHRWSLDESQIVQYGLSDVLASEKVWWEAISVPRRGVAFLDVGAGATTAVLICEDLARLDEVAEVLRYVGPTFVIALLLDGPQLATRWSSRYASVLADDPGSAVLTLTSLGMATRSQHLGRSGSRVIALWKDPDRGLREIELEDRAGAVLLTLGEQRRTVWTADGRCHTGRTPRLVLEGVHQLATVPLAGGG